MASFTRLAVRVLCGIVVLPILLTISGCIASRTVSATGGVIELPGKKPVRHFLIIGFGFVSVNPPDAETAVMAVDQTSLGVYAGNLPGPKLGIGYQQSTVTVVPDGLRADDVRIEVIRKPFEGLEIRPWSGILKAKDKSREIDKKEAGNGISSKLR